MISERLLNMSSKGIDRRRWRRLALELKASVRMDGSSRQYRSRVIDASVCGLHLGLEVPAEVGTCLRIDLALPAPTELITVHGVVVRMEPPSDRLRLPTPFRTDRETPAEIGVFLTVTDERWIEFCRALEGLPGGF